MGIEHETTLITPRLNSPTSTTKLTLWGFLLMILNLTLYRVCYSCSTQVNSIKDVCHWRLILFSTGDALNALKSNLNDPNNVLQSWDATLVNPCTWFHVTCNGDNSVTRVQVNMTFSHVVLWMFVHIVIYLFTFGQWSWKCGSFWYTGYTTWWSRKFAVLVSCESDMILLNKFDCSWED
jgi:hypothetical protein